MSELTILRYPDPRLHKIAKPVTVFDAKLKQLIKDMTESMYAAPGIGLAATQVNVHLQVIVIDISEEKNDCQVIINPEILCISKETQVFEEGCLSVPGIYDRVERAAHIKIKAQTPEGNYFEYASDGLMAVCVQHEIDHLKGRVFIEYLSPLKRDRIKKRLQKAAREQAQDKLQTMDPK